MILIVNDDPACKSENCMDAGRPLLKRDTAIHGAGPGVGARAMYACRERGGGGSSKAVYTDIYI